MKGLKKPFPYGFGKINAKIKQKAYCILLKLNDCLKKSRWHKSITLSSADNGPN